MRSTDRGMSLYATNFQKQVLGAACLAPSSPAYVKVEAGDIDADTSPASVIPVHPTAGNCTAPYSPQRTFASWKPDSTSVIAQVNSSPGVIDAPRQNLNLRQC